MPVDYKILGEIVRQERERRGLSQEFLAELSGLSRTYLSEIERGVANISLTCLVAIADGLGIQPSEILQEHDQRTKRKN